MTFTNNAEFEQRVSVVIGTAASWYVTDPDLDIDPEAYNEFSPMGCDICVGGAGWQGATGGRPGAHSHATATPTSWYRYKQGNERAQHGRAA